MLLIPLLFTAAISLQAQSIGPATLNAAGGNANISGYDFGWSVGEMTMVGTFTTPGIIVTQGLLQPSDETATGVATNTTVARQLSVFPNPATSVVNIQYSSATAVTLSYRLTDIAGKVVDKQIVNMEPGTSTSQVNVSTLACATYVLEVIINPGTNAAQSTSYKIQKLK